MKQTITAPELRDRHATRRFLSGHGRVRATGLFRRFSARGLALGLSQWWLLRRVLGG